LLTVQAIVSATNHLPDDPARQGKHHDKHDQFGNMTANESHRISHEPST
jgi:hypothetical protein